MTTTITSTPRALREYRALSADERVVYDPAGKPGAAAVRHLQDIARLTRALRDARHQARTNPQFPAWRLDSARRALFTAAKYGDPAPARAAQKFYALELGGSDTETAEIAARAANPRVRNWEEARPAALNSAAILGVEHEGFEYRGQFKGWHGQTNIPVMRSRARISNDGALLAAQIADACYTVAAGRGYRWDADANGPRLVRLADGADYHPTSDEVRAGRSAIVTALRAAADKRRATAAQAKRDEKIRAEASRFGVWVSFRDARAAGNCAVGIENFARRHNLDISRHYRAEDLPAGATTEEQRRVSLAILAAQRRQAADFARGYSEI